MASTSKAFVCAALLSEGRDVPETSVVISKGDLQSYSPATKDMVCKALAAAEFCKVTMKASDNTAINKALELPGGPDVVTAFLRQQRRKPLLNP